MENHTQAELDEFLVNYPYPFQCHFTKRIRVATTICAADFK